MARVGLDVAGAVEESWMVRAVVGLGSRKGRRRGNSRILLILRSGNGQCKEKRCMFHKVKY